MGERVRIRKQRAGCRSLVLNQDAGIIPRRLKRASGFLRTHNARAALPQNCSATKLRLRGESGNGTRVLIWATEVPELNLYIANGIGASRVKLPRQEKRSDRLMTLWPNAGFYCENTIAPGETPVVKALPVVCATSPLDELYV